MLEPSPDVALVQIIVDILTTVVLVLALSKLPALSGGGEKSYARPGPKSKAQKERAQQQDTAPRTALQWGNLALAAAAGVAMTAVCYGALSTRTRASIVTPYYEANSKPLTGAADIVGAIVVDFRGFDTMIEISVFSMAGIGVYTLLRYARQKHDKHLPPAQPISAQPFPDSITGIGGWRTSAFVHALANLVLPLSFLIGIVHMLYGHDQPGDGFTAGVIISLAIAFCYLAFGYDATRARLPWLRTHWLIGLGILTVMTGSVIPAFLGQSFFAPMDFGQMLGLPLPDGVFLSTSTMFELAICMAVMGSASHTLDTLGRPEDAASAAR
jgi:multicomponent K+:H+ antiporter subunit A